MVLPIPLKPEDRVEDDQEDAEEPTTWLNQPVDEDVISAMTEAQLLQIMGKVGAIRGALLQTFNHQMSPAAKRLVRIALAAAEEAKTLSQGVVASTTRSR